MPNILTRLRIKEISSVDRGAGKGVQIMLMKRNFLSSALTALNKSLQSIHKAEPDKDKRSELIAETLDQFREHLTKAAGHAVDKKESDMDIKVLAKALGLADTATEAEVMAAITANQGLKDQVAKNQELLSKTQLDLEILKANMSPEELKYHDGLKDDKAKTEFRAKTKGQREAAMTKVDELPESIRKALAENEAMKKQLNDLLNGQQLVQFNKQAIDMGLPEAEGVTLQKAYTGDKESIDKIANALKAANAQAKAAGLFKEFGGPGNGNTVSVMDELVAKAAELRKREPALSADQAFAKVYQDPANAALVQRERNENRPH